MAFATDSGTSSFDDIELLGESLDATTAKLRALGEASSHAAEESTSAFEAIGDIASAQIGSIAAGAFDLYADAIDEAISAGEVSAKSLGNALKNMLAQTLRTIGQEATVSAAFEVAKGIAAAANPVTAGLAPGHFFAAAQFVAVAGLAGAAAGALSTGGGGARGGVEPSGVEEAAGEEDSDVFQDFNIIGALDAQAAEDLNAQLQSASERRDLS